MSCEKTFAGLLRPAPRDAGHFRRVAEWGEQAAQALEHAHGMGVVHRDVKPANLMVDGAGKLWVMDFGLARTAADTGLTVCGDVLGTLRYMSPEQARAQHGLVDHRSDVYSLGVTLYELLTGRLAVAGGDRAEVLRRVAEEEPPAPRSLDASVPVELETVVLKAMAKEPAERYATAQEMADDLGRFLNDEPIRARPPGLGHRVMRWARRNRPVVWAAAACLLAILLVTLFALEWDRRRALASFAEVTEQQRRTEIALAAEKKARLEARAAAAAEKKARENEAAQRRQAEAVVSLMESLFDHLSPGNAPYDLRWQLVTRLDAVEATLEKQYKGEHLLRARLLRTIGSVYLSVGEPDKARRLLEKSLAACQGHLPPGHLDTLKTMNELAMAYQGIGQQGKAAAMLEKALGEQRLGEDHPFTITLKSNLGFSYLHDKKPDKLLALSQDVHDRLKKTRGPDDPSTLAAEGNLAAAYSAVGKPEKARQVYREVIRRQEKALGKDHPDTFITVAMLGEAWRQAGKPDQAVLLVEPALEAQRKVRGLDHHYTTTPMTNLALAYLEIRRPDKAVKLAEELLSNVRRRCGDLNYRAALDTMQLLARAYFAAGHPDKSVPLLEKALEVMRKDAPDHPNTIYGIANLGRCYLRTGEPGKAVPLLEEALGKRKHLARRDPDRLAPMRDLVQAYGAVGELARQDRLLRAELAWSRKEDPGGELTLFLLANLAHCLVRKNPAEAEPVLREVLAVREKKAPDHWTTFSTRAMLGTALLAQTEYAKAEPLLVQGYRGMKEREKSIPPSGRPRLIEALTSLVRLYEALGNQVDARKYRKLLEAEQATKGGK